MMKKLQWTFLILLCGTFIMSCSDDETYADKLKKERAAISRYIRDSAVTVISEEQFASQGYTTDVSKNEFVLFNSNGVYMQIIREGCGEKLKDGETANVLCRFDEYNLMTDSLQLSNNLLMMSTMYDKMSVTDNSGTFEATFDTRSVMYLAYGSTSVPGGWLVPFTYIKLGRPSTADEEIAKVRLIVPSTQGQAYASQSVYPCLYDITYERGR